MQNRRLKRALAVLTAAVISVSGMPITTGAEAFSDGPAAEAQAEPTEETPAPEEAEETFADVSDVEESSEEAVEDVLDAENAAEEASSVEVTEETESADVDVFSSGETSAVEKEMPLGETVTLQEDSLYTFTPKDSGFYTITSSWISSWLCVGNAQTRLARFSSDNALYFKKGTQYLFYFDVAVDNGTCLLSLLKQDSSYESCDYAGLYRNGEQIESYWSISGETMKYTSAPGGKLPDMYETGLASSLLDPVKKLDLEEGISSIPYAAFYSLSNLEEVSIPASVTRIGYGSFTGLTKLATVNLAANSQLAEVAGEAFHETAFLDNFPDNYVMLNNLVLKYKGSEEETTIPAAATKLSNYSMWASKTLKKINIQNNLQVIGEHSLAKCENLTEIEVPSSVTEIAYAAFASDTALEKVTLNEGIQSIGMDAFLDCPKVKEITIPKSVTKIGEHAIGYSRYDDYSSAVIKYTGSDLPTIYCWAGSAGQEYAEKEGIPYKLLEEKAAATPTPMPTQAPTPLKKGKTFTSGTGKYKVNGTKTVAYTGTTNKKATSITIGSTVTYKGVVYKITSITSKALRNHTSI